MRSFTFILFSCLIISNQTYSQNCHILDDLTTFKGLKFGNKLPDDLIKKLGESSKRGNTKNLFLEDIATGNLSTKYKKLFRFGIFFFSDVAIDATQKNELYKISLFRKLTKEDLQYISEKQLPVSFNDIVNEFTNTFGTPTKNTIEPEDVFTKVLGRNIIYNWECKKMKLELKMTFGSNTSHLNTITVTIIDSEKEKVEKINQLKS
jgi:hypothetical protein